MRLVLSTPIRKPLAMPVKMYLANVWSGWAANACHQAGRSSGGRNEIARALAGGCSIQSEQVWDVSVLAIHHIPYTCTRWECVGS